jgi:hypothetical protein
MAAVLELAPPPVPVPGVAASVEHESDVRFGMTIPGYGIANADDVVLAARKEKVWFKRSSKSGQAPAPAAISGSDDSSGDEL